MGKDEPVTTGYKVGNTNTKLAGCLSLTETLVKEGPTECIFFVVQRDE